MTTKAEPKHRGTLVCVVLKAKNLPNKRSIGKQDPYCVLQLGTEQQKTKPDKRGGQHPQWDEQLHFEIYEDMEDQLRKLSEGESVSSNPSSLSQATKRKAKAGKSLRVSCYADDNKEPEFIGEGIVDLTDTLRTGEFDEWVTIKAKERYAGEVYLELTFYSSAAPPKPKKVMRPTVPANTTYGGAGTFSEDFDESEFAPRPPAKAPSHAPIPSTFLSGGAAQAGGSLVSQKSAHFQSGSSLSSSQSHAQLSGSVSGAPAGRLSRLESVPSSLRPSASMAQMDSYTPPYAPQHIQRERSPAPISEAPSSTFDSRRDSFPPLTQSASAHFYGHRLPDAAPSSVVAQRIADTRGTTPLPPPPRAQSQTPGAFQAAPAPQAGQQQQPPQQQAAYPHYGQPAAMVQPQQGRTPSPSPYASAGENAHYPPPNLAGYAQSVVSSESPPKPLASRPLPSTGAQLASQPSQASIHQNGSSLVASPSAYGPFASQTQPPPPLPPSSPSIYAPQHLPPSTVSPQPYTGHAYAGYPPPQPSDHSFNAAVYGQTPPPPAVGGIPPSASAAHIAHYPPPPPGPPAAEYAGYQYATQQQPQQPPFVHHTAPAYPHAQYQQPALPPQQQFAPQHHQPPAPQHAAYQSQEQQYFGQHAQGPTPPPVHPHPPAAYYQHPPPPQQAPYPQTHAPY